MEKNNRSRKLAALNASAHRANVEAAAAADRHARDFSKMFSISADVESLKPSAAYLTDLERKTAGLDSLMETLSTCIRCHNCMNVCPICYCKECVFKSAVFEHRPDQFLRWAERSGAIRMPTDTLIFHLTRMSHMATSCVSCGMCDAACPNKLPISSLFGLIGSELQEMFEYVPGRDPEEEPPVSAFKEEELQVETEAE